DGSGAGDLPLTHKVLNELPDVDIRHAGFLNQQLSHEIVDFLIPGCKVAIGKFGLEMLQHRRIGVLNSAAGNHSSVEQAVSNNPLASHGTDSLLTISRPCSRQRC